MENKQNPQSGWHFDQETGTLTISTQAALEQQGWEAVKYDAKTVVLEPGVTTIGEAAFFNCGSMTEVTIPETVQTLGVNAFLCSDLTTVHIPASVQTIGRDAFCGCHHLTGIWVDARNPNYSSDRTGVLFNKDKTLLIQAPATIRQYVIPSTVQEVGMGAFSDCTFLESVVIPASVTTLEWASFQWCRALKSVVIPPSVAAIGQDAFWHCENLTGFRVDLANASYASDEQGALYSKDMTQLLQVPGAAQTFHIPASVRTIGDGAFSQCINLTSLTVPEGVTEIGTLAFDSCENLTSVTIPASMVRIGKWAFSHRGRLRNVYYGGTAEQWRERFPDKVPETVCIHTK